MSVKEPLLRVSDCGLFCREGNFYIDPWKKVDKAVITHAHSDHARPGMKAYLAHRSSKPLLHARLGNIRLQTADYGEAIYFNNVKVSLHPAGHVLGSSQVRVEREGEVWVVSGDYKIEADKTAEPFEAVPCHTFITESTFGLPVYRWEKQELVFNEINRWWQGNKSSGRASIIYAYSLGKAQRILAGLDTSIGPVITHDAVETINNAYREAGVQLPATTSAGDMKDKKLISEAIIIAPPSAENSEWTKMFGAASSAFASGWMQIRGNRKRLSAGKGFVVSDHADWDSLLHAVRETGADNIYVTHGYTRTLVRWLRESGYNADTLPSKFDGERVNENIPGEMP